MELQRKKDAKYHAGLRPEEAAELEKIDGRLLELTNERYELGNRRRLITNRALVRARKAAGKKRVRLKRVK